MASTGGNEPGSVMALVNAGLAKARGGDLAGAVRLIEQAKAAEPRNPTVLTARAVLYRVEGRLRDAVLTCDEAIRIAPDHPGAWLERGMVLAAGGSTGMARESFARAATLAPGHAEAHANYAAMALREGAREEAREAAEKALALDPSNLQAAVAKATVLVGQNEPQAAIDLLEPIVPVAAISESRSQAFAQLGRAREKLGEHEAAFAAFSRANEDFAAYTAPMAAGRLSNTAFIEAIHAGLQKIDAKAWDAPETSNNGSRNPIFLLGYPRSGTTLVENVLASIPGVAALEERPTLLDTDHAFLMTDAAGIEANIARFATLDPSALDQLRDAYWQRVEAAGVAADTAHFVDMDPLKGTRLPFIARLFPSAKIVVMRRDPRDVVLSCFRTDFAVTGATLEYANLERAARHYDALMRLTQTAMERLPLAFHELRYEALVSAFEPTTQALCDFAGLPWSEAVHDFAQTAKARGVGTASTTQVRRGLYDGSGQWKPYARWLEPVMPVLQPWVERFGYD